LIHLICHQHDLLIICKLDELLEVVVAQALPGRVACTAAAADTSAASVNLLSAYVM
jgi:hypothetical protein